MTDSRVKNKYSVPAVEKTFAVIELFASLNRGYTLSEVSRLLKLPISLKFASVHYAELRLSLSRCERSVLPLDADSNSSNESFESVRPREIAESELVKLTANTGLTSVLAIPDGDQLVWIEKIEGTGHIQLAAQVGKRMNLHHTSTGKAILAHLPDERVDAIVASVGLPASTQFTITSVGALKKELGLVRAQGYAIDSQETGVGILGVAAPVFDHKAKLVGSVGVGGAIFEMDQNLKAIIAAVKKCAKIVSEKLGYQESAAEQYWHA